MLRRTIETVTNFACWVKRKRVIKSEKGVVKVNLGSGLSVAPGWINVDASLNVFFAKYPKPILKMLYKMSGFNQWYSQEEYCNTLENSIFIHHDIKYGIPFPDESIDYIYSSHLLEHLYRKNAKELLEEARRKLRKGGVIRTCVPNLEYVVNLYQHGDKERAVERFFAYFSSLHDHRYIYDFDLLRQLLEEAGFSDIKRCSYAQGRTSDIENLDNRPEETLYVEACK